jgi:(p)ppGpp synthase/HD superfamily hydrolase
MICEFCHGQGMIWDKSPRPCPQCGGCGTDYCCGPSGVPDWSWASGHFADSDIEKRALVFAKAAHESIDQRRRYTNQPYIVHPIAVAEIVRSVPHSSDMIAAAYLHDTIEDCGTTREEIAAEFGDEVAELVYWLTDQSKPSDGNRRARKEIDRQHIAKAPAEAKTIKLADLIHNTVSIRELDPDFWRVYRHEKLRLLETLKEGSTELWLRAYAQCEKV